jgi:hypothetical protein
VDAEPTAYSHPFVFSLEPDLGGTNRQNYFHFSFSFLFFFSFFILLKTEIKKEMRERERERELSFYLPFLSCLLFYL